MTRIRPTKPGARAGVILAAVLATLFVATLFGLALVELSLMHHRQMQVAARQQQCSWLAESGLHRAVQRLAKSPDYGGETWTVPAEVLGGPRPGVVTIQVAKAGPRPGRVIRVEARFPDEPISRNVCQREVTVE